MQSLGDVRAFIIDMDGVLWEGDRPMPGLVDFFQTLRDHQIKFVLATNNASRTSQQYVAKLAGMGVAVTGDEILTSAQAAALYLRHSTNGGGPDHGGQTPVRPDSGEAPSTRIFVIGEDGLVKALTDSGFTLCGLYERGARYVVCGMDRGLSWDKLATATLNIRAGASFVGTNPDATLPSEHGLILGNGAILAALQAATGVAPIIIGKPEPIMYQQAMERLKIDPAVTAAIGDRMETDILGAVRAGIRSLLVLSGVTTREQLGALDYQPTWIMQDIREVTRALQNP
jgi:4-nitrophenyl phosphatase